MAWFEVDKEGLAKLLESRGKEALLFELIANAWDTDTKQVRISLAKEAKRPFAHLLVEDDDPEGFANLEHAYVLFAESSRKGDATKRGRFNLGEKLVLSMCREATIRTVTGSVIFFPDGTRKRSRKKTEKGSVFEALLRLNQAQYDQVCKAMRTLIPPITTIFNGEEVKRREPVRKFEAFLPTEIGDKDGSLRRTTRKTTVCLYEPRNGEDAQVYELGIPVVETGDRWHADIKQKVPLTLDRSNVLPSFLKALRAAILNNAHDAMSEEDSEDTWVTEALSSKDVEEQAVQGAIAKRFGKRSVAFDPSDLEANNRAISKGYTVVHGRSLPKKAWANVRKASSLPPAGQVTPTPKPYSDDPDADPVEVLPEKDWTPAMCRVAAFAKRLAKELMDARIRVQIVRAGLHFNAAYGSQCLDFNLERLGQSFFDQSHTSRGRVDVMQLLIHEFAHVYESNHLSANFYYAICRLGARAVTVALQKPEVFELLSDCNRAANT
jgi:hypothetical protein